MIVSIFSTKKKEGVYLYLKTSSPLAHLKDKVIDFEVLTTLTEVDLPEELQVLFGKPSYCFDFDISKKNNLALEDIEKVKLGLENTGYYLQFESNTEDEIVKILK